MLTGIAIAEHARLADHVRILQTHYNTSVSENEMLRRELQSVKMELAQARGDGHGPSPQSQTQTSAPFPQEHYQATLAGTELPPLRSISNGMPQAPDSMTGVQYDGPRGNGYRGGERY